MTIIFNLNERQQTNLVFPASPSDGQIIVRPDLGYELFKYNKARNEWWGSLIEYGWGVNGSTGNGGSFRQFNGMPTGANAGSNSAFRFVPLRFTGTWSANETGTLQVRRANIAQLNVSVSGAGVNAEAGDANFNVLTANGLIEDANPTQRAAMSLFWVSSATGSVNAAQYRLYGRHVLLPGE